MDLLEMNEKEKPSERNIGKAITDGGKWEHSRPKLSLYTNQIFILLDEIAWSVDVFEFYHMVSDVLVHLARVLLNQ